MIIHHLFPTPVTFFNLDRGFTKKELEFLLNQETRTNEGNVTSTDNYILTKNECMSDLKDFVDKCVDEYFQNMFQPKYDVKPYVTISWVNYTEPGQWHHKHAHPNSIISGVLYIEADDAVDKIHFFNDKYNRIEVPAKEHNIYNSASWWLTVKTCNLILFPSSLTHMVSRTDEKSKRRTSLAFNTFLKGNLGEEIGLTALNLGD
jgi:hypothetical protein